MGIPGLYGNWLTKDVAEAVLGGVPPFVASLSFDLNGVFHDARKQVFGEDVDDPRILQAIANTPPEQLELEIFNAVAAILLRMIQAINPRDCLILAVDGVAPGAKLQQQRGRREKSARNRSPIETFDRNAITPGTDFMIRLDNFMVRFIGTYRDHLPPKVLYSSHLVPGEGEHKIMDYYRNGEVSNGLAAQEGGVHILYGLDADLIMLSLLAPIEHIVLSRETVKQTVSIDNLKAYIIAQSNRPTAVDDFVVMMYLIGNDFLPQTPSLEAMYESITALLDIYVNGDYVLTRPNDQGGYEINWDSMKNFIQAIAVRENEFLAALSVKQVAYPSRFLRAALRDQQFYPELFRSAWYQNALGPKGQRDYIGVLSEIIGNYAPTQEDFEIDPILAQTRIETISAVTPDRITKMAIDYMRTMAWTYLYYREGTAAVNHDWAYPYYHTPTLSDLSAVMQLVGNQIEISGYEAHQGMLQFTALHQLIAVLPLKSKELLPIELQPLFSYNSIIRDLLLDNFIVELDGKDRYKGKGGKIIEPEGVAIVPLIDRRRIFDAVAQITFTPERVKLWMPADSEPFIRTPEESDFLRHIQFDKQRKAEFEARQLEFARRAKTRQNRNENGEFRRQPQDGRSPRRPTQPVTQFGTAPLVPTMTANQTGPQGTGFQRGRGGTRGGTRGAITRGGITRGGDTTRGAFRGRGGRATGTGEIRRPPTIPLPQTIITPTFVPIQQMTVPQTQTQTQTQIQLPTQPRQGPRLTPIGTNVPTGLRVGKGPTLTPVGATPVTTLPVGKRPNTPGNQLRVPPTQPKLQQGTQMIPFTQQGTQVIPVNQPTQQTARSPAQWQQLGNLM